MSNFADILDAPATDAVRPPALPQGTYVTLIKGLPTRGKSTKKGTPFIEYTVAFISAFTNAEGESDIDAEALEEFGEVQGKEMRLTFFLTENSAYRHREFLENDLRLDIDGKSHWEGAQEAPGSQFLSFVRQKPREDGKGVYSEIGSTAPMPE